MHLKVLVLPLKKVDAGLGVFEGKLNLEDDLSPAQGTVGGDEQLVGVPLGEEDLPQAVGMLNGFRGGAGGDALGDQSLERGLIQRKRGGTTVQRDALDCCGGG